MPRIAIGSLALSLLSLAACDGSGGDDGPELPACVEIDPVGCQPLYEPVFDRVFDETLRPRCGVAGGSCHGEPDAEGADNGLVIRDVDETFDILMGEPPFVQAGDAACSLLMVRVAVDDAELRMPPGASPLPDNELCSLAQWIEMGAAR